MARCNSLAEGSGLEAAGAGLGFAGERRRTVGLRLTVIFSLGVHFGFVRSGRGLELGREDAGFGEGDVRLAGGVCLAGSVGLAGGVRRRGAGGAGGGLTIGRSTSSSGINVSTAVGGSIRGRCFKNAAPAASARTSAACAAAEKKTHSL